MKKQHAHQPILPLLLILLFSIQACKKETQPNTRPTSPKSRNTISIQQAKAWYSAQQDSLNQPLGANLHWEQAIKTQTKQGDPLLSIPISGQPTFQNVKQGLRQLQIRMDHKQNLSAQILEIIPDAIAYQQKRPLRSSDFSGRIFSYNLNYQLQHGTLYSQGQAIGSARPANTQEQQAIQNGQLIPQIAGDQSLQSQTQTQTPTQKQTELARVSANCYWSSYTYVDAEGTLTVYAESHCTFYIDNSYDQAYLPSLDYEGGGGGGSSTSYPQPEPPAPSNLPMEEQPAKNPKKLMDCFGTHLNPNAAYQVKILVQQPQPGTSFNIGQNAFGHVAIQLSKTEGNSTITQTLGFYPTGTGFDKLNSQSRIVDNGGLEYNTSATYYTSAQNFQNLINYIKTPPQNYHYTDFNCTSFVYQAALKANLPIPNPSTQIGLGGPGGVATAMTPAGMASALNNYKAQNLNADISNATMRASASKGECN